MESINETTPMAEQQKVVEMEDTKARLEDEVKEDKEKQESPFWSKIPIMNKLFGKRESPSLSSESSSATTNNEEIGSVATDENKEQVNLFDKSVRQTNVGGDIGHIQTIY